ncbi:MULTISPECIES: MFS transporter [unclassified Caballeronia]|uniref:MFS transporter n=1 Tax=unclassified Caballeronia TaxID=2646786 RepID=UPI0028607F1B|nr:MULTISPECIES: MFS transporter [unclassified Caballeronia]MDR5816743.1 MFS transporter [Caballeronia sp. LZ033]MDR5823411.1 MFS transporter [Caballeronia sp. LZ043]MDR5881542.1 MFS transporter [Caballeronia sp. LZ032]
MDELEVRTMRRVLRRYVPLLIVCFVVSFLDRVNIGFAALTMNRALGFSATTFGIGAGLFFIGYVIFEVPSNLILERVGARRWIARIMLTWGVLSACMAFVQGPASFFTLRVLLGIAEAGFFPGIMLYFTYWIPGAWRARVVSVFMAAMPFANVFGSLLSGWLLGLDGVFGLHGWQLMFIAEGLPAVLLAFAVLAVLRDTPAQAQWLAPDERAWLANTIAAERARVPAARHGGWSAVRNPVIVALALAYFGINLSIFGLSFFLPQIVREFHLSLSMVGVVAAIPFFIAGFGMMWWGRRSDRHDERRFHVLLPMALAVIGLGGSTLAAAPVLKLGFLCLAAFGTFSAVAIFWSTLPLLLGPAVAAIGFGAINSFGNLAGFTAPYAIGVVKDATGHFDAGIQLIALYGCFALAALAWAMRGRHGRTGNDANELAATERP